jgi:hypothetical protein
MSMGTSTAFKTYRPEHVMPALATSAIAKKGMERVDLQSLGIIPGIAGGARGINARGDIVTQTADGVAINDLWTAYQDFLDAFNDLRDPLLNFLTWRTTEAREDLIGTGVQVDFEEASEYGEPVGVRPEVPPTSSMGYTFKWYDLAARFTWQFLADAPSQQIDSISNMAAEASNRLVFTTVLKTLFNNSRRVNKEGMTVYPFYSGVAGDLPPAVGATTFADSHNHFVTAAALNPAALEALQTLLREHGYTQSNGYSLVIMINEAQEGTVRNFRSTANGGTGTYDFIPAQGTSALLLPTDLRTVGGAPPASLRGMDVVGSYWEATIVKNAFIPSGYLVAFVTGGPENIQNPIAIREHPQANLRGLRLVRGRVADYPLIDSFYAHGFGTGVRYRGAGAVMQITGGAYTVPAAYAW